MKKGIALATVLAFTPLAGGSQNTLPATNTGGAQTTVAYQAPVSHAQHATINLFGDAVTPPETPEEVEPEKKPETVGGGEPPDLDPETKQALADGLGMTVEELDTQMATAQAEIDTLVKDPHFLTFLDILNGEKIQQAIKDLQQHFVNIGDELTHIMDDPMLDDNGKMVKIEVLCAQTSEIDELKDQLGDKLAEEALKEAGEKSGFWERLKSAVGTTIALAIAIALLMRPHLLPGTQSPEHLANVRRTAALIILMIGRDMIFGTLGSVLSPKNIGILIFILNQFYNKNPNWKINEEKIKIAITAAAVALALFGPANRSALNPSGLRKTEEVSKPKTPNNSTQPEDAPAPKPKTQKPEKKASEKKESPAPKKDDTQKKGGH